MKWSVFLVVLLLAPSWAIAKHDHLEKYYQEKWCIEHGGVAEVVLPDLTRCDCLTENHAVELDFGPKWAEAIGQALYYSLQTGKRAGVVLILEDEGTYKYWLRLNAVVETFKLPMDTWKIEAHPANEYPRVEKREWTWQDRHLFDANRTGGESKPCPHPYSTMLLG